MKMKTSELAGDALDWAVATAEGYTDLHKITGRWQHEPHLAMMPPRKEYGAVELWQLGYSTDWAKGGPIIEWEGIDVLKDGGVWTTLKTATADHPHLRVSGPTPLIAAMRCFVMSQLGDEIDVPEELRG